MWRRPVTAGAGCGALPATSAPAANADTREDSISRP